MEKARTHIGYRLPDADLATRAEQLATFTATLKKITQIYGVEGNIRLIDSTVNMDLIQEPQNLREALEELVNLELGIIAFVAPVSYFFGPKKQEEGRGFEITKDVLESAGYKLKTSIPIPLCDFLGNRFYIVKKKGS